jgi:hypothetical protein
VGLQPKLAKGGQELPHHRRLHLHGHRGTGGPRDLLDGNQVVRGDAAKNVVDGLQHVPNLGEDLPTSLGREVGE